MSRPRSASFWLPAAALGLAAIGIYGPSLSGGWVWDDTSELTQNPILRDPRGLARIWAGIGTPDYFPLKTSLQWLLWRVWGDSPAGFHLLSLGLHLLCAFLFWRLLAKLGLRLAWLGGLLFVVHPLVVESVAWAAELKNVLSLAFLLGAMLAYLDYDDGGAGRRRAYLGSLLWFLLALLSKSSVVMLPAVLLLYGYWRTGRISRRAWLASAPFFGLSLLLGLVTVYFQTQRALAVWTIPIGGLASRLAVAGTSLAFYLGKALWPFGLHPMYRQWDVNPPTPGEFLPWLGLALLLAWAWSRRGGVGRAVLLGGGFFVLNLLPVLGFVPMSYMHFSWVADHFAYLPLLGLLGLAVACADGVWRWAGELPARRGLAGGSAAAVVLVLAGVSRSDAAHFQSDQALWTYTLGQNPAAWMAHVDLGHDLDQAGRYREAIEHYNLALQLRPNLSEAYYNRGTAWMQLHQWPQAEADLERTLQLQPASPDAETNLGNVFARSGRLAEAVPHYEAALRLQPDATDARTNLAEAHYELGNGFAQNRQFVLAVAEYQQAVAVRPDFFGARANLGNALFVVRRLPEAIVQYERALELRPDDAAVRQNLGLARRALHATAP
jgi:tetratricopeptide (TPR) repeat protein